MQRNICAACSALSRTRQMRERERERERGGQGERETRYGLEKALVGRWQIFRRIDRGSPFVLEVCSSAIAEVCSAKSYGSPKTHFKKKNSTLRSQKALKTVKALPLFSAPFRCRSLSPKDVSLQEQPQTPKPLNRKPLTPKPSKIPKP